MNKQEVIISNPLVSSTIASKIVIIRDVQVMIDRDLAELYGVETKALNQAVKRNTERFPDYFCFLSTIACTLMGSRLLVLTPLPSKA